VVPKKSNEDGRNFNPILAWNMGISAVSMNISAEDEYKLLNRARFE